MNIKKIVYSIIVVLILLSFSACSEAAKTYKTGISALESGDYSTALTSFKALGDYKDAVNKYKETIATINENAEEYASNGLFDEAYKLYEIIGDIDSITESKYNRAKQFIEKQEFDSAYKLLTEIDDYKDSKDLMLDVKYNQAAILIDSSKDEDALTILNEISDYKDSANLIKEIKYNQAVDL